MNALLETVDFETPQTARDSANTKLTIKPSTPLSSWTHFEINSTKVSELSALSEGPIHPQESNGFEGAVNDGYLDEMSVSEELLDVFVT